MRKVIEFFKKRWVISVIGLIALSILIWFVGPLIAFAGKAPLASPVARLVTILVIVLIWGLNNLRVQMKANRASKEMMDGLSEPAKADSGQGDQSAEEIAILKERFDEAMTVLKKSAKGKSRSLYELPWYIIIGPPGSGKTTALVHSGLNFPLAERFGKEALRGVGGTRNCDWWFTDEAILLDTAGRYVTQDSHQEVDKSAWEGFLALLKRHRRRRPINGVLVAVSLSDLMIQSEHEKAAHVRAIKQRIQELNKHLGIRFPVYVLFTKVDLVAGFSEFFDDLGREERTQVWGVTFPFNENEENVVRQYGAEFDALMRRLNDRLLGRISNERDPRRRSLIYGFPQQMASLKETTQKFLDEVFSPSRFEEPPLLRGAYFTSGTQEGSPIDRMMGALARNFGLNEQAAMPAYGASGKSYFITNLLKEVAFPEADLAGANRRLEKQRAWLQKGAYAGAIGATVASVLAWSTSFTRNQVYVGKMEDNVADYEAIAAKPVNKSNSDFEEILPRLESAKALTTVYPGDEEGVPFTMGLGLYQGDTLGDAADEAYVRELNQVFLPRIKTRLEEQLLSVYGDPDLQYEALKTYLMLGDPERLDSAQLTMWMSLDWQASYPADVQGKLQGHLGRVLASELKPVELDERLVKDTRLSLTQAPLAELIYGRLKREYMLNDTMPFRVSDAVGIGGRSVFQRNSGKRLDEGIPGLFTYDGYHEVFKAESKRFVELIGEEYWVLGEERSELTNAEKEQLEEDLLVLYMNDYVRTWKGLLADLRIVPFQDIPQATELTSILSGPSSPMRGLLNAVARNTTLDQAEGQLGDLAEKAGKAAAKKSKLARMMKKGRKNAASGPDMGPEGIVDREFEALNKLVLTRGSGPAPLDGLLGMLAELYGQLSSLQGGMGGGAITAVSSSAGDISRRIQVEASRQPEPVRTWLEQVVLNSRSVTLGGARSQLNAMWQANVLPTCKSAIVNRYPVYKRARSEITLRDFGRFFGPGGAMDNFFESHLKQFVDTSSRHWKWKSSASLGISDSVLRQFQRAALIKETFFQDGGQTPTVRFALKPVYLDAPIIKFMLDIDGQQFVYRHGPTRVSNGQWPGPDGSSQVRVVFEHSSGARSTAKKDGPWALFRILDAAVIEPLSADRFIASFNVDGRKAKYEIRASSVRNPFSMGELQRFRCPESL